MAAIAIEDILLSLGVFGLLGSTILFPLLGSVFYAVSHFFQLGVNKKNRVQSKIKSIDVLVTAHNEEKQIAATLSSIRTAIECLHAEQGTEVQVRIIVGADACSDRTVEIARKYADEVREYPSHKSKWLTLKALIGSSDADWISLVDAGALWSPGFLIRFLEIANGEDLNGFAPGYRESGQGKLSDKLIWQIERLLKELENLSGGPISVHGATVLYRREPILEALRSLDGRNWYNDDVVLPLALRATSSESRILYSSDPEVMIEDFSSRLEKASDPAPRRKRLAKGNIQWISSLLRGVLVQQPSVGILTLRRAFRISWGWWILFLGFAAVLGIATFSKILASLCLIAASALIYRNKSLRAAFLVSLLVPVMLFAGRNHTVRWK